MDISLEKTAFLKVLHHGQSVIEKKTTIPILSHILLKAEDGTLSITATDMDMALIEKTPAHITTPGSCCVSAYLLYEIVRKLSDKKPIDLKLSEDASRLEIISGRSRFELGCLPVEDFPPLTETHITHRFKLPAPLLRHLIDKTKFCMSSDETRYQLNGIFFHVIEKEGVNYLRAVSADMHRLACVECESPEGALGMPEVIVSKKTIHEIRKLLDEADAPIEIGFSNTRVECKVTTQNLEACLTSRLIDATFPDYQSAFDVPNDKKVIVSAKTFAQAVDRVGTVVTDKLRAIRLKLQQNQAELSAISQELGSAVEEIDVDFDSNEDIEVCFNVKYLLDIAQQIESEEMQMELYNSDSSILIKPTENPHEMFILMPLNV